MTKRYVLIATVLFLGVACGPLGGACGSKDKSAAVVLATVNGREITQAQFDAYLKHKNIPPGDKARSDRALAEYLDREALADVIAKEGKLDAAEVEAEVREFEKQLLLSRYFDKVLEEKVNDTAIQSYYGNNSASYEEKKVRVAHVLFRLNPRMSEQERKAKLTAAQEAYAKLRAGGDFAEIAAAQSDDKVSAKKGGEIGWIKEGSIDPRFAQKVFAMQKDELSEPFETSFGFHVVKILEGAQTVKRPFQAVQGDIRYQLRAEAKKAEAERLQAKVKIERKAAAQPASKTGDATTRRETGKTDKPTAALETAKKD
jgi:peptidyl-prolyl cis-trans isomerase C